MAGGHFLFNPMQKIHRFEALGWFGAGPIFLAGNDIPVQVDVQGNFEQRFEWIYQLH